MLKFPRYKPIEAKIMERFLATGVLPGRYEFSVQLKPPEEYFNKLIEELKEALRIQLGVNANIELTPEERHNILVRHSWYIDAVVHRENEVWLLEVKPRLRKSLVGQLLAYKDYYIQQYKPRKEVKLGAVVGVDNVMVRPLCKKFGIRVFVIPP